MRKEVVVFLFVILLFASFFCFGSSQDLEGDIDNTMDSLEEKEKNIEDLTEKDIQSDYLKQEWVKIIRENAVLGKIDKLFTAISPVFVFLIKEPYSLSFRFFFLLFLGFFIFVNIYNILRGAFFKTSVSYLISLVLLMILAFTGFFQIFYSFLLGLFNVFSGFMKWIIIFVSIGIFLFIEFFVKKVTKSIRKEKEKEEKEREKENRTFLDKIVSIFKENM